MRHKDNKNWKYIANFTLDLLRLTTSMNSLSRIISLTLFATIALAALTSSRYNTAHNIFGSLRHPLMQQSIAKGMLCDNNTTTSPLIHTDTTALSGPFRYFIRIANLHNKPTRSYSVTSPTGDKSKISNPQWGLVFNFTDSLNYHALLLQCHNIDPANDIADRRSMTITLHKVTNGTDSIIGTFTPTSDIDLYDRLNAIGIETTLTHTIILAGQKRLHEIARLTLPAPSSPTHVGYILGPGAKTELERTVLTIPENNATITPTHWTIPDLNRHFSQSTDPVEGYYSYLDRDTEDKWLRLGGRYTIAIVRTPTQSYDIIYISGAQVRKDIWRTGYLKGTLTPTQFTDNYTATWLDATFRPFNLDVQAKIEAASILTIRFPVYSSQIRFYRHNSPTIPLP